MALVEQIENGAREVTVLFADLRGFTKTCETLTPAETIDLLNRYYEAVSGGELPKTAAMSPNSSATG